MLMKGVSKKHLFVLFALMQYLKKVNKKFKKQPLAASVSKINFIRILKTSKITAKSQRGLYRNLEVLEKKKLIDYDTKFLKLTKKGLAKAREMEKDIIPYLSLIKKLEKKKIDKGSLQAHFK